MGMLSITNLKQKDAVDALQKAMISGNETEIQEAWCGFQQSIIDVVKQDFEEAHGNLTILAQRGYRQLTPQETNYYNKLIEAGKSANPQQAMTGLTDIMPETIIEEVYKDLSDEDKRVVGALANQITQDLEGLLREKHEVFYSI